MDPASYLTRLIDHLVEATRSGRTGVATGDIEGRVESAAAALAAAGLLEPADLSRWQERALDAMEAGGLIQRLDVGFEGHARVVAARAVDERVPPPPGQRPLPEIVDVVPVNMQIALPDGTTLVLLSLNRWSTGFDLMYAIVGLERPAEAIRSRHDSPLDWDWSLTDDFGLRYGVHRAGGGGGDGIEWRHAHASPALRPDARALTVHVARHGSELFSATVQLDGTIRR